MTIKSKDRSVSISRRTFTLGAGAAAATAALPSMPLFAQAPNKVTLGTSWKAEAEHGGFYQALATGIYDRYGLAVTIRQGGPQIRYTMQLAAGEVEFSMGESFTALNYVKENVPLVCVMAPFQKDVRVLISHPGVGNDSLSALKGKPILVAGTSRVTFWPYLKARYAYTEEQVRPYAFSIAPFLADKTLSQQGYLTTEPLLIEKAGVKPVVHLLAADGYVNYANTLETTWKLVRENPDLVQRFVSASIEGWYSYLYKDPTPANTLIKKDNPEMTDEIIAYGIATMKQFGIIDSGDALTLGVGTMSDARWKEFHNAMTKAGMYPADLDLSKAYTLQFVNKRVGMNLKG